MKSYSELRKWNDWKEGKPAVIHGKEFSTHRFNPNVVAISTIQIEEIGKPNYIVWRVVTSVFSTHESIRYITHGDQTKFRNGKEVSNESGTGRLWGLEVNEANVNHQKMVDNLVNSVRNPNYKVTTVTNHTLAETFDEKLSRQYNSDFGLCTRWKFSELPIGTIFGFNRPSNGYTKTSESGAIWGHNQKETPVSPDTNVYPDTKLFKT